MNIDNNDLLISRFLRNELTPEEKNQFSEKLNDNSFFDEVQLRMALQKAVEKADSDEFEETIDKSIANFRKKSRQRKRTITLYSILSLAAAVLLFIFFVIPLSKNETKQYLAMAGEPLPVSIENIRTFRAPNQLIDSSSIFFTCSSLKISSVPDKALINQYFFKDCVFYTNFNTEIQVSILVDFDANYNKVYYLCKDESLYHITVSNGIEDDKLYPLLPVTDSILLRLCN